MSKKIEILLADNYTLTRVGIRALLAAQSDFVVSGEAVNKREIKNLCSELQPDVLVLDIKLAERSSINSWLTNLHQKCPAMQVVLLLSNSEQVSISHLLASGVAGGVLKEDVPKAIELAIRTVMCGGSWFSRSIIKESVPFAKHLNLPARKRLTKRENQVLQLLTSGMSNRQIARELKITERTTEFHLGNIFKKINVTSRLEAAVWAKELMLYN